MGDEKEDIPLVQRQSSNDSNVGYHSTSVSSLPNGEAESNPSGTNGEGHRFHFTFDDRFLEANESTNQDDDDGLFSGNLNVIRALSTYFDPYSVVEGDEEEETMTNTSTNKDSDDHKDKHEIDSVQISADQNHSTHHRLRSSSIHTTAEESMYFEPFEDEIYPREEDPTPPAKLSSLALSVLVFYNVSGGPFGMEPAVKAGGAFYAILGFTVMPLVWSIPEALITAELGTAYPEPSGGVAWVEEAFGTKAGLIAGYLNWVSGATDNAIYPALFLQYVVSILSVGSDTTTFLNSEGMRFCFTVLMTLVLAWINYRGLEIVGALSILVCIISMSPFLIMCLIGIFKLEPSRWFEMPLEPWEVQMDDDALKPGTSFFPSPLYGGVLWRPFLNNLFWNLNSFDAAGSFAGEIADSGRVFPRAMAMGTLFVVAGYLLPLIVGLGAADTDQLDWKEGYLAAVSAEIGGKWLGAWTVLAAGIANLALFEAEMSSDAFQLMGMARRGLLPKVLSTQSQFGTPTYGILIGTIVIVLMSVADFSALVEMLNFAYSLSLLMEYAAFIKLRITHAHVPRPYRIPLGTVGCCVLLSFPTIAMLLVMAYATKMTYIYISFVILLGFAFYHIQKLARRHDWCEYVHVGDLKVS